MKCQDCGQPLSDKRKAVIPTPLYCIECQEFYDKNRPRDNSYASAVAVSSEGDDISRWREEGWM